MGIIKEYVDRAVQTETGAVPSPYADPAVVLAAPPTKRCSPAEAHAAFHNSISASSHTRSVSQSPTSPILAPLVSRRLSKRKHARCAAGEIANRRIVSMPENKSNVISHNHTKRIVSMPDRVRPVLEPSVELFHSTSTVAEDSFGSYSSRHERVRVLRAPSDVPQTPSPPSSPESLLIIATGTQLSEGFLRRKYSPEPLIEEDEDWITWANSPPRPIPALHGPLSLPYARCPSGAEGTIIEEPDNVAQMIWGLGPDDQSHNQFRVEGISSHTGNSQNTSSHGPGQVPPRLQKKRTPATQQVPKLSRTHMAHTGHAKQSLTRSERQAYDDRHSPSSQVSPDIDARQEIISGLPWNEGQSMQISVGTSDNFTNDSDLFPADNNRILEWQLARLRQALRTSLADMDSYHTSHPGRFESIIPAAAAPGLPQTYPRIFVEPRPNESVSYSTKQPSIEISQKYRQEQLYRQALQKQKLQIQNILPTPPNSSSPQWSSHFSPYLTYGSAFSPEPNNSTEHPIPILPVSPAKYRSSTNSLLHPRHVYERHERDDATSLDMSANVSPAKTPQTGPDVNSAPSLRQSSSCSSTLAKYIKQLQALSPVTNFSPPQPVPLPNASSAVSPPTDNERTGPFRTAYRSPVVPTPPSPESPQTLSRGSSSHGRRPTRPVQRRLSSVPEEDSAVLELSMSFLPSRLQGQNAVDGISCNPETAMEHQIRYDSVARRSAIPDFPEFEGNLGTSSIAFHHETSPVKVRLPATKEHLEQSSGQHEQNKEGHQHGHRKKQRYKKFKGPAAVNEQATTRGLVG